MTTKGFTVDLAIDGKSWTAFYEDVETIIIKRRIGAGQKIHVKEIITVEAPINV